jgi:hypothetical protein
LKIVKTPSIKIEPQQPLFKNDIRREGGKTNKPQTVKPVDQMRSHETAAGQPMAPLPTPEASEASQTPSKTSAANSTVPDVKSEHSLSPSMPISPPKHILDAYTSLFAPFYSIPPFSPHATSLSKSLPAISLLLALASFYQALPALRPHILTHLTSHHAHLYRSIALSPPTYLLLSLPLQSSAIFTEAIIHIVARYPSWPWSATPPSAIPNTVMDLIERKSGDLRSRREAVERYG